MFQMIISRTISYTKLALCTFMVASLSGCGTLEPLIDVPEKVFSATIEPYDLTLFDESVHLFNPAALTERIQNQKLVRRVDNLIVLLDSTDNRVAYRGVPEGIYQREVLRRFNRTLPRVSLNGGIWRLGDEVPDLRLGSYIPSQIEVNLDKGVTLPQIGVSDLADAVSIATELATDMKGRTALLILSRWERFDTPVLEAIDRFYQRGEAEKGFQVVPGVDDWEGSNSPYCVYAVGIGNSMSRTLLEGLDRCGDTQSSDSVMQPRDMAHFVEKLLFIGPADSDQDGIYDFKDECPDTPIGTLIGFDGCARFSTEEGGYSS